MVKRCFKCKITKNLELFYKHPRMADGHLNKCKECTKKDVRERWFSPKFRDRIIAYERKRNQNPERKKKRLIYQLRSRHRYPGKNRARAKVQRALKDGRLIKKPCEDCGDSKTQAHHTDYRRPLFVKWFCRKHHMMIENKIPF